MAEMKLSIRISSESGQAKAEIVSVGGALDKLASSGNKATASLQNTEKSTEALAAAVSRAKSAFAGLVGAMSVRELAQVADTYSGISSKLKLVSGNAQEYANAQRQLFALSQQSMTPLTDTVQLYSRLATSMKEMGRSQAETLAMTDLVGKSLRISGADAASSAAGIQQFAQAMGSGVLRGDEFNSIMENSPRLAKALADGLHLPISSLREMAEQGKLTAETVTNALLSQSGAIESEYKTMPLTVSGAFQQIKNSFTQYIGQADQAAGASKELAETLSLIADNLNEILDPLTAVVKTLVKVEVGGWLTLVDAIKAAKVELKEMVGLQDGGGAIDPEVVKLMRYGSGQASVGEIAGPPAQAVDSQKQFFDGVKKNASDSVLALTKLTEKQKEVAKLVIETAKAYKVDPAFALAIAQQESGFNQLAKSAVGARGVMQLMPGTAKQLGVNFADMGENIKGGVMYLAQQEKQFKSLRLAAAAYNAGPGAVQKYHGVPPYKETQNYVVSVGALYEKWQKVLGAQGEAFVSAKDQAEDTANAFERIKTHEDDRIQQAAEYAKLQVERVKTNLAALDQERQALSDVTAEQMASATGYQEKQAIIEDAAKKADSLNRRALAMVREEFDAQQKALEVRRAALQSELQQSDKYNVALEEQDKLKQAIRATDNELAVLTQNRAQAEIAAGGKANDLAKQSADLKRQESQAVKDIIQDYTRQLEIFQRLSDAKAAGASSEQLSMLGNYYQSAQQLPEVVSPEQLQQMEKYRLSTIAIKEATDALTDSGKSAAQSVQDQQLAMNAFWDQYIGRIEKYNETWAQVSGGTKKGFSQMIAAAGQYAKNLTQIEQKYKDINTGKKTKFAESLGDFAGLSQGLEQASAAFGMLGQQFGAMAAQQEKGSAAWKQYNAMAMASIAVAQVTAIAQGLVAVATAMASDAKLGGFGAIAAGVAVAASLASFGIQMAGAGGGGGGGGAKTAAQRQQETGTGGVWGDPSGQTQSIANSLEMLQKNSTNDLNYSAGMLRALESIDASIKGTTNAALINFRDMAAGMADKGKGYAGINDNKSISDWGIAFSKRALEVVLEKGMPLGDLYVSNNRSNSETTAQLGKDGPGQAIAQSIRSVTDALIEGGKAFGLTADDFKTRLKGFVVDLGIISLKGLKGDEIEKQFSIIMSNLSDKMAKRFMPGLDQFRKVGEGYSETFWRVAEGINRATGELEQLGLTAIDYKDVARKQGDVAAEMVRQTLQGQYYLTEGVREYIGELTGSAEDIISAYKKLTSASSMLRTGGFNADNMDRTMINAGGGLEAFTSALEKFNEEFLTTGEVLSGQVRDMGEAFTRLGQELPTSKDGFLSLVRGIDTSTEAGKKLFGQLMALSGAFADMQNQIEEIKQKYADILNPFAAIADRLKTVATDFQALIDAAAASIKSTGPEAKHISELEQSKFNLIDGKKGQKELLAKKAQDEADIAVLEEKIAKEMEKKPGKRNKANLKAWNEQLKALRTDIINLDLALTGIAGQIAGIDSKILAAKASNDAALAGELAESRLKLVEQAGQAMTSELTKVFDEIAKTLEAAQQRLQAVLDLQKNLASQLAQIQGPQAVLALAQKGYDSAKQEIEDYVGSVKAGGGRDVATETTLIQNAQQAVMDKYNAETAAIQEAERAYIAAETQRRNESLRAQSDAINAATDLAIEAENDRLNAAIKAQSKIDQAALKSQQKAFDAANKLTQKQFDAEQKALDKAHQAQLDALSKELDAANRVKDAIKAVGEYVKNMTLGANSPLSPEQKLAEAKKQFESLQSQAMGGDAEAIGKLTGASDAYLEAAKNYYGSGTQYSTTFEAIKAGLEATSGLSFTDPDSVQARIDSLREAQSLEMDALRESQAERLDAIREVQQEQLDAAREAQQEQLDAMRKASQDAQEATRKAAQDQIEALQRANQQAIQDLSDPSKNEAMKAAREAAERDLQELQRLAELTRIEAQKQADEAAAAAKEQAEAAWALANQQLAAINEGVGFSKAQNAALLAIASKIGVVEIPQFASGGIAGPGLAIVGEQGPEMVAFSSPARVYSASDTKNILSGGDNSDILQALAEIQKEARASVVIQSSAYPQVIDRLTQMEDRLNQIERKARRPA